ncbi:MAG TPA: BTAD domain-containing putative transcriptional regulator [Opitutaceae bacterium]|nr:BTAD domain-containing putative transcriptional regulator [Opitutaceae bacterium]
MLVYMPFRKVLLASFCLAVATRTAVAADKVIDPNERSYNQANADIGRGDYSKAATELTQLLNLLNLEEAAAYNSRSHAWAQLGESAKAIQDARTAVAMDPGSALTYESLGRCLEFAGQTRDALLAYQEAKKRHAREPHVEYLMGIDEEILGDDAEACRYFWSAYTSATDREVRTMALLHFAVLQPVPSPKVLSALRTVSATEDEEWREVLFAYAMGQTNARDMIMLMSALDTKGDLWETCEGHCFAAIHAKTHGNLQLARHEAQLATAAFDNPTLDEVRLARAIAAAK